MNKIKKTLFTLCVDNYAPQITRLTFPLLQHLAEKTGYDFYVIKERRWPDMPPVYEKLQIYYLGREMKNDWNWYLDADTLVHPDMFDPTNHIHKDTVMHNGIDMASIRWTYDEYFLRDGRNIGSCNWFSLASDWCLDLWTPLDIPFEEAVKRIHPVHGELMTVVTPEHLIDDYTLSRNIARFGLKLKTFSDLLVELGNPGEFLWHQYQITNEEKVIQMCGLLKEWNVLNYYDRETRDFILKNAKIDEARRKKENGTKQ